MHRSLFFYMDYADKCPKLTPSVFINTFYFFLYFLRKVASITNVSILYVNITKLSFVYYVLNLTFYISRQS